MLVFGDEIISGYDVDKDEWDKLQKNQIETLVKLEKKFRLKINKHKYCNVIYKEFIRMIIEDKKNILAAQPYFRERKEVFAKEIIPAIKNENIKNLSKYNFNYLFISFVLNMYNYRINKDIRNLATQIEKMRNELVELNMPLAISRARIFWSKTPKSHRILYGFNTNNGRGINKCYR
ncbi:MAG: hypothetical protein KGO96_07475 [Elusimicrobia bacterium]|nr:hypothetical protein [Elusimicrobiota bacterium]